MIDRRTFGRAVGLGTGTAAASLAGLRTASATAPHGTAAGAVPVVPVVAPGTHTTFARLRKVTAGELEIGYAEAGPAHGPAVICLHGWPYDIHSYVDVAPLLAAQGYRVVVPYLRGHGTTRFLSARTFRNAQQSAIALDVIALMDALRIDRAVLAGFDWGTRTADIVAALWPQRVKALVAVSGYLVTDLAAQLQPTDPKAEHAWWYQYYFATERGAKAMDDAVKRHDLCRLVWDTVSPGWDFDDATFERTAAAFGNPDYAAIVLHNYRWRLSLAAGERRYDHLEQRLTARPPIAAPTVVLDAELDPSPRAATSPTATASPARTRTACSRASATTSPRRPRPPSPRPSWTPTTSDPTHPAPASVFPRGRGGGQWRGGVVQR